jgi:hypothetical protein
LVGDGNELPGQFLKAPIVGDQGLNLLGLCGGDTLGELLALNVALEDIIRALLDFGVGGGLFEELAAQGTAAKAVDGLNLLEDLLAAFFELGERSMHGCVLYLYRYNMQAKKRSCRCYFSNQATILSCTR